MTFIIHTFKRPECLDRLLESIKEFYPKVPVIVYDDSKFDKGLSWGRNHLVSQVKTKYFLLLDDDFVFTKETKIEKLIEKAEQGYDIVAGALRENGNIIHYEGRYELENDILKLILNTEEPLDFVFNFFIGRTEKFKECKWDEDLKLCEHTAFFFDNKDKLKVGYEPSVIIEHKPVRPADYMSYRLRAIDYAEIWKKKKGIKDIKKIYG